MVSNILDISVNPGGLIEEAVLKTSGTVFVLCHVCLHGCRVREMIVLIQKPRRHVVLSGTGTGSLLGG